MQLFLKNIIFVDVIEFNSGNSCKCPFFRVLCFFISQKYRKTSNKRTRRWLNL